jgi:hypothetical protein
MDSVTVRVRVAEFFATMIEISEWLDDNHYQHKVQIRPSRRCGRRDRRFPGGGGGGRVRDALLQRLSLISARPHVLNLRAS